MQPNLSSVQNLQAAPLVNIGQPTTITTNMANVNVPVITGVSGSTGTLGNPGFVSTQTQPINYSAHSSESSGRKGSIGVETFTFRPLEGKFINDIDTIGKMDPYCKIKVGWHSGKTSYAKGQGRNPTWSDIIVLERKHNEKHAKLKVKDKDSLTINDKIGDVKIDLSEVIAKGKTTQWYTLEKGGKATGEILMEIEYQGYPSI